MRKHVQDLGTELEQEMALSGVCDCEWCQDYRMKHGYREIQDSDFYAIGSQITKDNHVFFRVNDRQKIRNRPMYRYRISVVTEETKEGK
jgi:hypothetical protein